MRKSVFVSLAGENMYKITVIDDQLFISESFQPNERLNHINSLIGV